MGTLTIYAIKSSITLALLYLPYTLLLRKETFFRFNRAMLLCIVVLSLVLPCLDVHIWDNTLATPFEPQRQAISSVVLPTLIVGDGASAAADVTVNRTAFVWSTLLVYIYIIGMLFFLLWKAVGLIRLIRFIPRRCLWTDKQEGATIYCHADRVSPFSWMRAVVVGEQDAVAGSPVLMHELTHVNMRHSWDTLFLSFVEVLQWFNPCIWMLDASLREVHEYEADDAVLRRGISAHDYQLLLIEKAVGSNRFALVNAFHHSLLKNRITMMTKKKSPRWACLKVLYAVPLTLVALGAMASQQMAEKVEAPIAKKTQTVEVNRPLKAVPGTLHVFVDGQEMSPQEPVNAVQGKEIKNDLVAENELHIITSPIVTPDIEETTETDEDDKIIDIPEKNAEFPDTLGGIYGWISRNICYPEEAQKKRIEGRVAIQFVIEKDGSIGEVKTLRSPSELLTAEAERVVKAMPKWKPALIKDKPVRVRFVLPIMFKLPTKEQGTTIAVDQVKGSDD